MCSHREQMLNGQPYLPEDPTLVADRRACRRLVAAFNATAPDDDDRRRDLLGELLGSFGPDSVVEPRLCCDYGKHISISAHYFVNYDAGLAGLSADHHWRQRTDRAPRTTGHHPAPD
ncbi:maltose acetyltransferase domain-containing protein [Mycolicibacter algericus]|uniref:Maltose/galactoside acetyltransferase domain-containing protein n=3 Tax=Mycolicibacter algericus TaxID=1288388 RepID=A0A7I9YAL0_MYCAL|nr:maltose acetyltransferase domain-containing protein [Mycolicibacter algericus]GFG85644.1 hypothetical protein MALGJ_23200 [Mycolicibacter algericus]